MRKKIIASRSNKENERPPPGSFSKNAKREENAGGGKDGEGLASGDCRPSFATKIHQKMVEKLEHINKRWQAEAVAG